MKIFACPTCGGPVFFDNLRCACGAEVVFNAESERFHVSGPACANRERIGCNWSAARSGDLCRACAMTRVVPDVLQGENRALWGAAELAKRWALFNLAQWGWFTSDDPGRQPSFQLLAEATAAGEVAVMMGHADGVVTINVTEADMPTRAARQDALHERYRTMIGHFRHELGHFVFLRLATSEGFLDAFRDLFGDERADYGAALNTHYASHAVADDGHITRYASSHPHEDWAEAFAHLLHLVDLVDSFVSAGLQAPGLPPGDYDVYADEDADRVLAISMGLVLALNHVSRSVGLQDVYPFVLSPRVREKLRFVHRWVTLRGPSGGARGPQIAGESRSCAPIIACGARASDSDLDGVVR